MIRQTQNNDKDKEKSPLKKIREQAELTQPALGRLIGVSDRNIRDWEMGISIPRLDRAVALARVLKVPIKTICNAMGIDVTDIPDDEPG